MDLLEHLSQRFASVANIPALANRFLPQGQPAACPFDPELPLRLQALFPPLQQSNSQRKLNAIRDYFLSARHQIQCIFTAYMQRCLGYNKLLNEISPTNVDEEELIAKIKKKQEETIGWLEDQVMNIAQQANAAIGPKSVHRAVKRKVEREWLQEWQQPTPLGDPFLCESSLDLDVWLQGLQGMSEGSFSRSTSFSEQEQTELDSLSAFLSVLQE